MCTCFAHKSSQQGVQGVETPLAAAMTGQSHDRQPLLSMTGCRLAAFAGAVKAGSPKHQHHCKAANHLRQGQVRTDTR